MSENRLRPEDLYRLSLVSNPTVDGDGRLYYTLTRMEKDKYVPAVWTLRRGRPRPLVSSARASCPTPGPDGLLAVTSPAGKGETAILLADPDTGEHYELTRFPGGVLRISWLTSDKLVVDAWSGGSKGYGERDFLDIQRLPPYFNGVGWRFDRHIGVYLVEVPSGRRRLISPEGVDALLSTPLPGGRAIVYAVFRRELEPYRGDIIIHSLETGATRAIATGMNAAEIAASKDGGLVAIQGNYYERGNSTHYRIYLYKVGEDRLECATCDIPYNTRNSVNSDSRGPTCQRSLQFTPHGDLVFPLHVRGSIGLNLLTPGGTVQELVPPGEQVVDEYAVAPEGSLYTAVMTSTSPKELHGPDGEKLTSHNRWLEQYRLEKPTRYTVQGGEVDVDYWVLPPVGVDECDGCAPWVLYIHGGPKTSWGHGFMFEFHLLSHHGISVVAPNPRGSDGYTEEFADIRGRYGEVDYEDIMIVAKDAPRRDRRLSRKRKGVMGGSYGGWMTNYITTRDRGFASAITMRSCANWTSFYGASDIGWYFAEDQLGDTPWDDPERYIEASPLFSADKVRTPTLIIHSLEDYRCPPDQAIAFYTALRINGVKTRLALFPGENHDLMRSGTPRRRVARLRLILEWLEDTLKE